MQHKKQEYILAIEAFIDDYRDATGVIPTMPEIAAGVGLSTGTICKYIAHMREQGIIGYDHSTQPGLHIRKRTVPLL
jgi:SOS-response transcriptional repressor LexA